MRGIALLMYERDLVCHFSSVLGDLEIYNIDEKTGSFNIVDKFDGAVFARNDSEILDMYEGDDVDNILTYFDGPILPECYGFDYRSNDQSRVLLHRVLITLVGTDKILIDDDCGDIFELKDEADIIRALDAQDIGWKQHETSQ